MTEAPPPEIERFLRAGALSGSLWHRNYLLDVAMVGFLAFLACVVVASMVVLLVRPPRAL